MILYRKPAIQFGHIALLAGGLLLAGCSSTALPPGKSVLDVAQAKQSDPLANPQQANTYTPNASGFPWAGKTLQATGQGTAPEGMPTAQAALTAKNAAHVHALTNLKSQVKTLPVGSDQTVGSIMDTYITVRHAVEQEIGNAQLLAATPLPTGGTEAQVKLPLQNIATILQQYQITPDQELPDAGDAQANVPDMI